MSDTHFRVCDLGESADGLWCSTTYLEMGVSGVGLVEPIFACAILGDTEGVQLHL